MIDPPRKYLPVILASWMAATVCLADERGSAACPPPTGVALQVLGSGGPIADDGRASTAYLVWVDGKARIMVDAGGGSFLRFGEAGARFGDLDTIALSHYHTDHSADLPALLKSGYFSDRTRPLALSGPAAGGPFPGLEGFLKGLLAPGQGAYRYLSGYLDGSDGLARLDAREVDHRAGETVTIFENTGLRITALGVPHGVVPALAFRVEVGDVSLVFGTDQDGGSERFIQFALGADVLVAHMAIPENAGRAARRLHATPSAIGVMASRAKAGTLVLSHFMARSLAAMPESLEIIGGEYEGDIVLADDLACVTP